MDTGFARFARLTNFPEEVYDSATGKWVRVRTTAGQDHYWSILDDRGQVKSCEESVKTKRQQALERLAECHARHEVLLGAIRNAPNSDVKEAVKEAEKSGVAPASIEAAKEDRVELLLDAVRHAMDAVSWSRAVAAAKTAGATQASLVAAEEARIEARKRAGEEALLKARADRLLAAIRNAADRDMEYAAVKAAEDSGLTSADIDAAKEARAEKLLGDLRLALEDVLDEALAEACTGVVSSEPVSGVLLQATRESEEAAREIEAKRLLAAILDAPDDARLAAAVSAAVAGGLSRARIDAAKTEQGKACVCGICLEPLKRDVIKLDCVHRYHKSCIGKWLAQKRTCPLCRTVVTSSHGSAGPPRRLSAAAAPAPGGGARSREPAAPRLPALSAAAEALWAQHTLGHASAPQAAVSVSEYPLTEALLPRLWRPRPRD